MDFCWSEEQEALRRSLTQFAQNELESDVVAEDQAQEFSWDGWRKCARFGIQGMPAPGEYGGGDADILTMVCALEALGYGCRNAGLIFSLNAHLWGAVMPIAGFGSAEQKQRLLPRLVSGECVGAEAVEELGLDAGKDACSPGNLGVRAQRSGDGWSLSGAQRLVTNASVAGVVIVYAASDVGPTAFIVEKGTPGLELGPNVERMGLRTCPAGPITLAGCAVSDAHCLGEPGTAAAILAKAAGWQRVCVLAGELGLMAREFDAASRYATERRQFGQPIGEFPAIAAKLAGMETRLEAARLLVYKAAWLKRQGRSAGRESAIAKAYVADAAIQTCRDALQIHGGYGYMSEYQIERDLRDAIAAKIYSGASGDGC